MWWEENFRMELWIPVLEKRIPLKIHAHRVGSLEVGKDADIAVFSGNPLEIFSETLYTFINTYNPGLL